MNEAVALAPQQDVVSTGVNDLLALAGFPSQRRSAGDLTNSIKGITSFIDGLLAEAISAQTKVEFEAIRNNVFWPYAKTVTALAELVQVIVARPVIEKVLDESFSELEADFREQGLERFGPPARDQAMFTVWTLRRTSRLLSKIATYGPTQDEFKEQDQKVARHFRFCTTWTQFHLDCLLAAIRQDKPIQIDVMPEIIDGLRAAVNAYGYANEALDLRIPKEELSADSYIWDEEDQALLDSSMRALDRESLELTWSEDEAKALNARKPAVTPTITPAIAAPTPKRSPVFGTHLKEGIDIIKDWVENPKPKK